MKNFNRIILSVMLLASFLTFRTIAHSQLPAVTTYLNNFDGTVIDTTWKPEHATDTPTVFNISQKDGLLTVVVDKNTGIAAGIGVYGFSALALDMSYTQTINMKVHPFIKVRLKADKAFTLGIGPAQVAKGGNDISQSMSVPGDNAFHTYVFNFNGKFAGKYDSTMIDKFYFNFNPGWADAGKYAGTVTFDFLKIGDDAAPMPSVTTFVDNFDGSTTSSFWSPEHATDTPPVFTLTQKDGLMTVVVDKNTGIAAGIGVYGFSALALDMSKTQTVNMKSSPYVEVKLKADKAFKLGVGPVQSENGGNDISQSVSIPGDNAFHTYAIDFTGKFAGKYDSTQIDKFYFNFNPGWADAGKYAGTVTFDYLKIIDASMLATGINQTGISKSEIMIYPNPATDYLYITNCKQNSFITFYTLDAKTAYTVINKKEGQLTIPIKNWNKGLYLIRVQNDTETVTKRVIIK